MAEWSCAIERLNERGTYIFVEWSHRLVCENGEKGQRDLVCRGPLDDWAVMLVYVMSYARARGE